ncbi:MAG: hypothetical protein N2038_13940 [Geminicoccaceae bacterium]|nr:hypothetical protein [Geminicoccaceae bacterium]
MDRFLSSGSLAILLLSGLAASMLPKPEGSEMLFTLVSASAGLAGYWLGSSPAVTRATFIVRLGLFLVAVSMVPCLAMIYHDFVEHAGPGGWRAYLAWASMASVFAFVTFMLRVVDDTMRPPLS